MKYIVLLLVSIQLGAIQSLPVSRNNGNQYDMSQEEYDKMVACLNALTIDIAATTNNETLTPEQVSQMSDRVGDVVLSDYQCEIIKSNFEIQKRGGLERDGRKAVKNLVDKWPIPILYYLQRQDYKTQEEILRIEQAFQLYSENTCLRFEEVTETDTRHRLNVLGSLGGCWTYLGRREKVDNQPLSIETGEFCTLLGVAMHEIGHAIGLTHEQVRPDRDQYVTVLPNHVTTGYLDQYQIEAGPGISTYNVPYDYSSVMHYGSKDAAKDGVLAMTTKNALYQYTIGQTQAASFMDYTVINRAYNCSDTCQDSTIQCFNGGYPNPGLPTPCQSCLCPDGLEGDCKEPKAGDSACSPLSGNILVTSTTEECVTSPSYPNNYQLGQTCNWLFQASAGSQMKFRFDLSQGFGLAHSWQLFCHHYVEIKYNGNLTESGPRFCGTDGSTYNMDKEVTTASNEAVVIFNSEHPSGETNKGFKLCYTLIPGAGTTTTAPGNTTTTTSGSTTTSSGTTTTSAGSTTSYWWG